MKRIRIDGAGQAFAGLLVFLGVAWSGACGAVVVYLDTFAIVRDSVSIFTDRFDSGGPPPSAPAFSNGTLTAYTATPFAPAAEAAGKLRLDSSAGVVVVDASGVRRRTQSAALATNTDASQPTLGLKIGRTFSIAGTFDLTIPSGPVGEGYGIRVVDNTATPLANNAFLSGPNHQQLSLQVRYNPLSGADEIAWVFSDFDQHVTTVLASAVLAAPSGADQVVLEIDHAANSHDLTANYAFLDHGVAVGGGDFNAAPGQMFELPGETWVRPMFFAIEAVPEPGTLGLCALGVVAAGWRRRRRA